MSILRGEIATTARQEVLQVGYLYAVAAAAGSTLASPWPDVVGADWHLEHPHSEHVEDPVSQLKLQLKATYQVTPDDLVGKSEFSFTLDNDHLEKLNMVRTTLTRLLVVMLTPRDEGEWIDCSPDILGLRHCCYWVNLAGKQVTGVRKTTVHVATANVFDDVALCKIMADIGQGVVPR